MNESNAPENGTAVGGSGLQAVVSVPCLGTLCTSSWAGTLKQRVRVVGETPKRYRIEALKRTRLGGRRRFIEEGETALVPKFAVKLRAR